MRAEQQRMCRAIKDYQSSNAAPFSVTLDETFQVSERVSLWNDNPAWIWTWCVDPRGQGGRVPKSVFMVSEDGRMGRALTPYTTEELTVSVGEELLASWEESGWIWCATPDNRRGRVPLDAVIPS